MHHDRHSYLCRVVKLRHPARRHIDASVTSVVYPYASAESTSPVSIVEALTGPCDAEPVFYRAFVFRAVSVVAFEDYVPHFIQDVVGTDIGSCSGSLASCNTVCTEIKLALYIEFHCLV